MTGGHSASQPVVEVIAHGVSLTLTGGQFIIFQPVVEAALTV